MEKKKKNMAGKESIHQHPSTIHPGDHQKTSPLWVAAWKGHVDIVVVLLRSKADPHLTLGPDRCVGFHGMENPELQLWDFMGYGTMISMDFCWISMESIGFQWIFVGFQWIPLDFNGFYWI